MPDAEKIAASVKTVLAGDAGLILSLEHTTRALAKLLEQAEASQSLLEPELD